MTMELAEALAFIQEACSKKCNCLDCMAQRVLLKELDNLRERLRIAEAVRDDARAASQKYLDEMRKIRDQTTKHTCQDAGLANCEPCIQWRVDLWHAISDFVMACGRDPAKGINSPSRMKAVSDVERIIIHAATHDFIRAR